MFSFNSALFTIVLLTYNYIMLIEIISYAIDNNDVNLHGHVTVDKQASKSISKGFNTLGGQIGLGATMAVIATAVASAIAKSGMPRLQKAALIVGGGAVSGVAHAALSAVNRSAIRGENTLSSTSNINPQITKLVNHYNISPLQDVLFNGEMFNYICLSIIYVLIIQFIYKLYIKYKINLRLS